MRKEEEYIVTYAILSMQYQHPEVIADGAQTPEIVWTLGLQKKDVISKQQRSL